jgi:hypothetical protein
MRPSALKSNRLSGFMRIHQAKIRNRKAQIRARALGKRYDGFCLAKYVDPEILRHPLNLSRAKIPAGDEE